MALQISPEMVNRINDLVAEGDYPDADALLDQALLLLEEHHVDQHLRTLLEEGMEDVRQGRVHLFDDALWESIRHEARERFDRGERARFDVRS